MKTERLLHGCAVPGERKALSDTSDELFVLPSQLLWAGSAAGGLNMAVSSSSLFCCQYDHSVSRGSLASLSRDKASICGSPS